MFLSRTVTVIVAAFAASGSARGQSNFTWANAGTDMTAGSSWIGGVVPTPNDSGFFIPNSLSPGANPFVPASQQFQLQNLTIANSPLLGNYSFSGGSSSSLALATGSGVGTLFIRGLGATVFDTLLFSGNSGTQLATMNLGAGSNLALRGNATANSNIGQINFRGGQLTVDNSIVNNLSRLMTGANNLSMDTGNLTVLSNAAGGTMTINTGTNGLIFNSGDNQVAINTGSAPTGQTVVAVGGFNRSAAGAVMNLVVNGAGTLGGAGPLDPQFRVNGVTSTTWTVGNLVTTTSTSNGTATGHVFVNGADFAAVLGLSGGVASLGAVNAAPVNSAGLSSATGNVNFIPNAGGVTTLSSGPTLSSLKLTVNSGETAINLNNFSMTCPAVLLPGTNDFTITDSGTANFLSAAQGRTIYVTDPNTTLTLGARMGGTAQPMTKSGDGILALTGSANLFAFASNQNINLNAGTLRATITGATPNLGSSNTSLRFRGGVLEIANGSNGAGASADFIRPLGSGSGTVSFGGSGGFSAFGAAATVNIGGAGTPANLQWGQSSFVQDGYALIFGSTKSNAALTFLNPIQLDNGTTYQSREIRVIGGAGADATVMSGVISGAATADLFKTGTGTLVLPSNVTHTYSGNTYVVSGTLRVDGVLSNSGGPVVVGTGTPNSGTLSGTGIVSRSVLVQNGGSIKPGSSPGILNVVGTVTMGAGAIHSFQYAGPVMSQAYDSGLSATPGAGAGANNHLTINGNYTVDPNAVFKVNGNMADYTPNQPYSFRVASVTGTVNGGAGFNITNPAQFDFSNFTGFAGATNLQWHNVGNISYLNFTPVPEPLHILLVAGVGAAGFHWVRRRRSPI
jgi:autotransporter-associated beta strand protein